MSAAGAQPAARDRRARRFDLAAFLGDPRLPVTLFATAVVLSGGLLIALTSQLTFYIDDWEVLLHRRGFNLHAFMTHHAGHPSISLAAVYKAIQASFGMDSLTPYAVASTLAFLASVVLLFIWMRRRVGDWLAFAGTLPLLFLGTAHEDLLTPFQIGYFAPMACGIGALLALERGDRRGDLVCCLLLVVAVSFQTVGLVFAAGAAVAIFLDGELRGRFWVAAVPVLLYGLWYLGYGDSESNSLSFDNVATAPGFIIDGLASSIGSVTGLTSVSEGQVVGSLDWGRPLLAALVVIAAVRLVALRSVPKWLWVVLAAGVGFWFLTALNANEFRHATTSRYQYIGVIFVLMAAAELARGVRPRASVVVIALVLAGGATAANVATMKTIHDGLKGAAATVRGGLGGLEIAAETVDPALVLEPQNSNFNYFTLVDAGSYLSAAEAFDSPAYSPGELESAPEAGREAADKVLAAAHQVALRPVGAASGCEPVAAAGGVAVLELPPGSATVLVADQGAGLRLRRYASESFPVELGRLTAGEAAALVLPVDASSEPWELEATGGVLGVCAS